MVFESCVSSGCSHGRALRIALRVAALLLVVAASAGLSPGVGPLKRALGDLDRVSAWLRVFGMVNSAPGFDRQPNLINGFSDLILELYGPEVGDHARSAVGRRGRRWGCPSR